MREGGKVALPMIVPVLGLEIKATHLSDTQPTPAEGYEIVLVKDLGYTKLWIEAKVVES